MNIINYTSNKQKNKHLTYNDYKFIEREYNHFIYSKNKVESKTSFMRNLANKVHTCLSNLYKVLNDGLVELLNSDYTSRIEFSCDVAFNKRQITMPNNSKVLKAQQYLELIEKKFFENKKFWSIETIVKDLEINHPELIENIDTVSLKTIYNYINSGILSIKPIDLPLSIKRKIKPIKKEYKKTKGRSIDERPDNINNRLEFGNWEGDTIIGKKGIHDSAIFTLVERKTRFQIAIKIKDTKATTIYREINKLEKYYGKNFSKIFKSITFDNGVEFSRYKDIEVKKGSKVQRTTVYFAHPYSSFERGTNERHNRFLRFFVKKGAEINAYSKEYISKSSNIINLMPKKVLNYKNSLELFNQELKNII